MDICHNYSEAAESIASSPAVISKHIAKVEKELGLRIFERASKSRPVELTPAGQELITYFHSIVGLYKQMSTRSAELRREGGGSLVVGYCPFIGNFHEAEMLTQFSLENPEISVRRRALNAPELVRALLSGTVNAIFLPIMYGLGVDYSKYGELPASDFIVEELFQLNTLTLGIPDGHPLAQCERITQDMFPLLHDETFFFSCAQQDTPLSDRQRNQIYQLLGFKNDMKVRFVDFNEPTIALKLVESVCTIYSEGTSPAPHCGSCGNASTNLLGNITEIPRRAGAATSARRELLCLFGNKSPVFDLQAAHKTYMLLLSVSVWYLKVNTNTYIRGGAHYAACKKRSVL